LAKNCKLQFFKHLGRFCTQTRHFAREKLEVTARTRAEKGQISTPCADTELDQVSSLGIENRVIVRVISLSTFEVWLRNDSAQLRTGLPYF